MVERNAIVAWCVVRKTPRSGAAAQRNEMTSDRSMVATRRTLVLTPLPPLYVNHLPIIYARTETVPSVAFHRLLEAGAAAEAHASFVRAKREQAEEAELRKRFHNSSAYRTMKRERDLAVSKWIVETISKRDAGRVTSWLRVVCATNAAVVLGGAVLLARRRKEAKQRMDAMLTISLVIKPKIRKWQKKLAADKLADFLTLTLKSNMMRTAGTRARRNVGLVQRLFRSRRPCTEALVDLLCGLWVSARLFSPRHMRPPPQRPCPATTLLIDPTTVLRTVELQVKALGEKFTFQPAHVPEDFIRDWIIEQRQEYVVAYLSWELYEVYPLLLEAVKRERRRELMGDVSLVRQFCMRMKRSGTMVRYLTERGEMERVRPPPQLRRFMPGHVIDASYLVAREEYLKEAALTAEMYVKEGYHDAKLAEVEARSIAEAEAASASASASLVASLDGSASVGTGVGTAVSKPGGKAGVGAAAAFAKLKRRSKAKKKRK